MLLKMCAWWFQKARFEILEALSKSLKLSEDVDLRALSAATEGFTGADLQSIVYTAQLSSLEFLLGDSQVRIGMPMNNVPVCKCATATSRYMLTVAC